MGRPPAVTEGTTHVSCRVCSTEHPWTEEHFYRRGYKDKPWVLMNICKSCSNQQGKKWASEHRDRMREHVRKSSKRPGCKERANKRRRDRYKNDPVYAEKIRIAGRKTSAKYKEKYLEVSKKYYSTERGKQTRNSYKKRKKETDPNYRIALIYRERMRNALIEGGAKKKKRSLEYAGCTVAFLRWWIESQFLPGMHWGNIGSGENQWQVDHFYPCTYFDLQDERQINICFGWTNLRPLWAKDNLSKGNKVPEMSDFEI